MNCYTCQFWDKTDTATEKSLRICWDAAAVYESPAACKTTSNPVFRRTHGSQCCNEWRPRGEVKAQ